MMIIGKRKKSLVARLLFYAALLLLAGLALLGGAVRLNLISPLESFDVTIKAAVYGGSFLVILSLPALFSVSRNRRLKGTGQLLITFLIGVALAGPVFYLQKTRGGVPAIHDITTDTLNPPAFTVLKNERAANDNSPDYAGETVADQQLSAYPAIRPLITNLPQDKSYQTALGVARELGWNIVFQDGATGRIEATDRTAWFRFVDDIVIIVSPSADGSRIDLRSASRRRSSDLGTNARRIMAFIKLFNTRASGRQL